MVRKKPKQQYFVQANYDTPPTYPTWGIKPLDPDLQLKGGIIEFDLSLIEKWLDPVQAAKQLIQGFKIWQNLLSLDILIGCLTLRDLEAIKRAGTGPFDEYFKGEAVFAFGTIMLGRGDLVWDPTSGLPEPKRISIRRSLAQERWNLLSVPYLYKHAGQLFISWRRFDAFWRESNPILRFDEAGIRKIKTLMKIWETKTLGESV